MAHSSRTWTGARTPQALKRVRQAERRHAILQPRKTAAKTYIAKAVAIAAEGNADETRAAMIQAVAALDKAAKVGAIHRNAADRRKSRLMLKINAAMGGAEQVATGKVQRQTGKAAAA
ncbi:MAG: 30S ribosomal protein S20, partial [Candidatus Limnocylindrales bacterium]